MKHHPQDNGHNVARVGESFDWKLKVATQADVDPAVETLSDHMSDQQRQAFRDKLQRYVQKQDRDLILAVRGLQILGLVCVIEQAPFPPGFPEQQASHLRNFACGTQILVHPSYRKQGIGGSLLMRVERWAQEHGLKGFWHVTHRKAEWYKTSFGYRGIAQLDDKGVEKLLMAKSFE